uniref:Protein EFR3 n=1 Tax=Blastobotrys adeninivorans TaxID=409370 RepID=A0A060TAV7_BLAAD
MKKGLTPKHQRLVLQCYPAGRVAEKKPNASELSYLLYYVSARRAKLSKVGPFLERTARHDLRHNRVGNAAVTLGIIKALIERCHENLNLFSWNVIAILSMVLETRDLSLCQQTAEVFAVFCQYQDSDLFLGDPDYAQAFTDLISRFLDSAKDPTGPNFNQWRLIGVHASRSVAASSVISVSTSFEKLPHIIRFVLSVLDVNEDGSNLQKYNDELSADRQTKTVPVLKTDSVQDGQEGSESFDEKVNHKLQIMALDALNSLFENTGSLQVSHCTRAVVRNILERNWPQAWSTALLELATKWTPVQLRFVIPTTLADILSHQDLTDLASQLAVTRLILALFTSSVTMVGLSVLDICRSLLSHQHSLVTQVSSSSHDSDDKKRYTALVTTIRKSIAAINNHTYYADQMSDMVYDILSRCRSAGQASSRLAFNPASSVPNGTANGGLELAEPGAVDDRILLADLETARALFMSSSSQGSGNTSMGSSKVSLRAWDGTQPLLLDSNKTVRLLYVAAFEAYVTNSRVTPVTFKPRPDFSVTRSPLGRLLLHLYALASSDGAHKTDYLLAYHVFTLIVNNFGTDGLLRVVPTALMLLDSGLSIEHGTSSKEYYAEQGVAQCSLALSVLLTVSQSTNSDELSSTFQKLVDDRKKAKIWYEPLEVPLTKDVATDVNEKARAEFDPVDSGAIKSSESLSRDEIRDKLVLEDLPDNMRHILVDKVSTSLDTNMPESTKAESTEEANGEAKVPPRARSLKQLHSLVTQQDGPRERIFGRNVSGATSYLSNGFNTTHVLIDKVTVPGVKDLKRIASGTFDKSSRRSFVNGGVNGVDGNDQDPKSLLMQVGLDVGNDRGKVA